MDFLYPLWLFFSALFFYFAYIHFRQATQDIRQFTIRDRGGNPGEAGRELAKANTEFVTDFNSYLSVVNQHNRNRHRAEAVGFFIAGVTALFSMFFILFT